MAVGVTVAPLGVMVGVGVLVSVGVTVLVGVGVSVGGASQPPNQLTIAPITSTRSARPDNPSKGQAKKTVL